MDLAPDRIVDIAQVGNNSGFQVTERNSKQKQSSDSPAHFFHLSMAAALGLARDPLGKGWGIRRGFVLQWTGGPCKTLYC
jgi:hypothetical protein